MTRHSRRYQGNWVISELLTDRAERFGSDVVSRDSAGRALSYAELASNASRIAGGLRALGVGPGDRVATMLPPSHEYLAVWFGTAWAGAIEVPVNTDLKGETLRHVLTESGARVLVTETRWAERAKSLSLPGLEHVVEVGSDSQSSLSLGQILTSGSPLPPCQRDESDPAYIMFTSGTTGPSKGAVHSNRSALWNAVAWLDVLDLGQDDIAYSMFPLFHVTARSAVITSTIWAGGSIALRDGFSATRFWPDVRESQATFFAYMGSVVHLLYSAPGTDADTDHSIRRAFGAAAPPEMVEGFERRFGFPLLEVYGSTELGLATAPHGDQRVIGAMGGECSHVQVAIAGEDGRLVDRGSLGEIVVRPREPQAIFQGYWARPEETLAAFRDLWFHTGDRGFIRPDGQLVFVDRIKDCIRRRGENISSFEVERAVQLHPSVLEAAAYAVPSDIAEEEVAVAVVPIEGVELEVSELFRFMIEQLPRFAVPRYIRVVEALPKTPSQRVQKFRLREDGRGADIVDREDLGITVPKE